MRAILSFWFVSAVACLACPSWSEPVQRLEIFADIPTVAVSPQMSGSDFMQLPGLTFTLTVNAVCDENWLPASVSIGIADVTKFIVAEQLQAAMPLESTLQIPANQIAPLRMEHFCIDDEQQGLMTERPAETKITISAVLSAHASLRCATDSEQSISYIIKPLDVTLECSVLEPTADPVKR